MDAWLVLSENKAEKIGKIIPLSLLMAKFSPSRVALAPSANRFDSAENIERAICLGAARQNLDAVMIYEVYGKNKSSKNALSIANLSIIGAYILPTQRLNAVGHASAVLIDTRNGYPYLTASKTITEDTLSTLIQKNNQGDHLKQTVKTLVVQSLVEELFPAISQLKSDLEKSSQHNDDQSVVTNVR